MVIGHSFFLDLAKKEASEEFFEDRDGIRDLISRYLLTMEEEVEASDYNYPQFELNLNKHLRFDNLHNAVHSTGCGCKLCKSRYRYSREKRNLAWFRKMYEDDHCFNIFDELFIKHSNDYGDNLTQSDFFRLRYADIEKRVIRLKQKYQEVVLEYKDLYLWQLFYKT